MEEVPVVTCVLRNRGAILLLRRGDAVGSYPGRWGAVAGHVEGDPEVAAWTEIREETGLEAAVELVRVGEPFPVPDADRGTRWLVHPYLFESSSRAVTTTAETTETAWLPATAILRRETVPGLWESYHRVAPSVASIRADRTHGSATLSVRALEILRDRAGSIATGVVTGEWPTLLALARELRDARPAMVVLANRVNRAIVTASAAGTPDALEAAAIDGIDRAVAADDRAATTAADRIGGTVLTCSRSGTTTATLRAADVDRVLVAESRPGGEGVTVAEAIAADYPTTLVPDAGVAHALCSLDVDAVLVGADAIRPDGAVVNKVGTRGIAIAAAHEAVPVVVAAARDKVAGEATTDLEPLAPDEVYDGEAPIDIHATRFDVTDADLVTVCTEDGPVSPAEIAAIAADHRRFADWEA